MLKLKVRPTDPRHEDETVTLYGHVPKLALFTITRAEWTALPPGDYDARDWLHPDRIEMRIFARMAELLRERMPSDIGGYNIRSVPGVGGSGNPITSGLGIWLPVDWDHTNRLAPTEEAMRKIAEAKNRSVAEQRDSICEWLAEREGRANAY